MINSRAEKAAVYTTAAAFNDFGWFFLERTTADFGIDAFVELSTNERPNGRFLAVQIKGGSKGLKRGRDGFQFYIKDNHRDYWLGLRMPMLIVVHDQEEESLYWEKVTADTIQQTDAQWKIEVPYDNVLSDKAAEAIAVFVDEYSTPGKPRILEEVIAEYKISPHRKAVSVEELLAAGTQDPDVFRSLYFLGGKNEEDGLCLALAVGKKHVVCKLDYEPELWEYDENTLSPHDKYYSSLIYFQSYLQYRYDTLKKEGQAGLLGFLKKEVEMLMKHDGIEGIVGFMFDVSNLDLDIPLYDEFVEAFERYIRRDREDFEFEEIKGHALVFHIGSIYCEIMSWQGRVNELKLYIKEKQYDAIYNLTHADVWSDVFNAKPVAREVFLAELRKQWESYWKSLYTRIKKETGSTDHLEDIKNRSLRQLQAFEKKYKDDAEAIELAWKLDDMILYPLVVIAMVQLNKAAECYKRYCEIEFYAGRGRFWIPVSEMDGKPPRFYVQEHFDW
ncbi:MAG: DUF4365 domain-containing protein [Chitinophagaceae bacterium]